MTTRMITPPPLEEGDTVGIVAPARSIKPEEIEAAIRLIESWGLWVVVGKNLYSTYHQLAGKDEDRASDLQQMMDDENIKAILCARGGYGTVRTMQHLDFHYFARNPKWIVGFSDITVLHNYINQQLHIKTLHAQMPLNFPREGMDNRSTGLLKNVLFGRPLSYSWDPSRALELRDTLSGTLTGGNLSVICSLSATPYDLHTKGKILFLEDVDEYLYHIDRMMMNLKLSGKLETISALLLGGMTSMNDNSVPFGKEAYQIVYDIVDDLNIPVVPDCPAGHREPNLPLIMGSHLKINQKRGKVTLEFAD
ncbi:MAG: LD-carboxypeptidase [Bacteroidales bacterium]|nr:LD-carboxypeptidase [Bacteroidales bacterium]